METGPVTSFTGLATGLDTGAIVDGLVALERRPISLLQQKQKDLNAVSSRLSGIKASLNNLKSIAEELDSRAEVLFSTAKSSDETAVSVTADGGASLGTFDVAVTSLATAERTYSDAFADKSATGLFGSGTLTIQVGADTPVDITVTAADTLETLVSKINASGANVTAGILYDGTNYRLQVSGNDTGAADAIAFTETGTTLGLTDPLNERQAAADAVFSIDGFAMTRGNNLVADAIPGVTIELLGATIGTEQISISRDPAALEEKLQELVSAYNAVTLSINKEFAFSGQARIGDSLSGDATLRSLQSRLRSEVSSTPAGLSAPYDRLAAVGIESRSDGTLELDAEVLKAALADDPEAVAKLFVDDPVGGTTGIMKSFAQAVDDYAESGTGFLSLKITGLKDEVRDISDRIDRMEDRIATYQERLTKQFTAMEQLVASLQSQGAQMLAMLGQSDG